MEEVKPNIFIDPYSDFGFKKLFGEGSSPGILLDFLNAILKPDRSIVQIEYIVTEQLGDLPDHRKSFFDIYCLDADKNHFIIEVQQLKEAYYPDRALFYSTFPVRRQGIKGNWSFQLKRTYTISILNFCLEDIDPDEVKQEIKLVNTKTQRVFSENLVFIYLQMPKFRKEEHELVSREDQWFYVLNNMASMSVIPLSLQDDRVFKQFFMDAKLAAQREDELMAYYASRKEEWEKNAIKAAGIAEGLSQGISQGLSQGISQGLSQGILQGLSQGISLAAVNMLTRGVDIKLIQEYTGLSLAEIQELARTHGQA